MTIVIATEYSSTPGGRHETEGPYSGEIFRDTLLETKYLEAKTNGEKLIVDLDGCYGFATSFLEEAFGGLVRKLKGENILKVISIKSDDEPGLIAYVDNYVKNAISEK